MVSTAGFEFLDRACAHLRVSERSPIELEINVWDNRAADSRMPSLPWSKEDYGPQGEIRGFNDARFRTAFDHLGSSLSMLDVERGQAIFLTRDACTLPQSERGAPLKTILHWWCGERGRLLVHGGAVGDERGGVLLAGAGGAGKSTTALLCALSGMQYLGDDYCALGMDEPPQVYGVYGTGKVAWEDDPRFERFGLTSGGGLRSEEDKALFYLNEVPGISIAAQLPLRAILLPRIEPGMRETKVEPANPGAALRALAPSTISQLSGGGATTFSRLGELVRGVPCFELRLARDLDRIPERVREILG